MKKLIALLLLVCPMAYAANPSFQSFLSTQFDVTGNTVGIKNGVSLTNPVVSPGSTITGNGAGLTNMWVRDVFMGNIEALATTAVQKYGPLNGQQNTAIVSVGLNAAQLLPKNGYLSNVTVAVTSAGVNLNPTTNIFFGIYTNVVSIATLAAPPVISSLVCTLDFTTAQNWTNSVFNTNYLLLADIPTVGVMGYLPSASLGSCTIHYKVEWWHQTP